MGGCLPSAALLPVCRDVCADVSCPACADASPPRAPPPPPPAVLVTLSLGLASFSLAGLYCNHADLSPRYASVLLGMTNTSGALPGIVGVAFTGGQRRTCGVRLCVLVCVWMCVYGCGHPHRGEWPLLGRHPAHTSPLEPTPWTDPAPPRARRLPV